MNKFKLKLRLFLAFILIAIVFWLLFMAIVPLGKIAYSFDFSKKSNFIGKLTPSDRTEPPANGKQKIIGAPVYFTLKTPRKFDKAKLILKYENIAEVPLIEAGVLIDKNFWQYNLEPIENQVIDDLAESWAVLKSEKSILLQRNGIEKKYDSIADFLSAPPDFKKIALYNYAMDSDVFLSDYEPEDSLKIINEKLVGAYQFFTYLKNEDLYFNFTFVDKNNSEGESSIEVFVYYRDKRIDNYFLKDDGDTSGFGKKSDERNLKIELKNMPEGFYKIVVKANDDIITEKIGTKQSKVSFINKINLARDFGQKQEKIIYTDSKKIQAQTVYPDRLGVLLVKELASPRSSFVEIGVNETYKQFESERLFGALAEITNANDGMIISGDGVFSFGQSFLINPGIKKVDANLDVDREGVDYILADYDFPSMENGKKEAWAEFDLSNAYFENNEYTFIISMPTLRAEDGADDYIYLKEIKVELEGTSLFEKLKKIKKL